MKLLYKTKRYYAVIALLLASTAIAFYIGKSRTVRQNKAVKVTVLENGFTVMTSSVDNTDTAVAAVVFKVGSSDENADNNGISHLLEHMSFKGTKNHDVTDIAKIVDRLGGRQNAWTSTNHTVYHINGLKEDIEEYVSLLADMTQNSTFPDKELAKERGVIKQEIKRYKDDPWMHFFITARSKFFTDNSPAKMFALGNAENIDKINSSDLSARAKEFHRPNNGALIIFGDIKHSEAVSMAKKYFNSMGPAKEKPAISENVYQPILMLEEKKDLQQMHVGLIFNTQGAQEDIEGSMLRSIGSKILSGKRMSGAVFREIREKRGLSYQTEAGYDAMPEMGLFWILADCSMDRLDELYDAFLAILNHAVYGISDEEVAMQIRYTKVQNAKVRSQSRLRLRSTVNDWILYDDPNASQIYNNLVNKITAQQVREEMKNLIQNAQPSIAILGNYNGKKHEVEKLSKELIEKIAKI